MIKPLLTLLIFLSLTEIVVAQDFPFGEVSQEEMDMKNYSKDASAHAVVLKEFGKAGIGMVTDENIRLIIEYHVKIKIFDDKGFDNGTVVIPIYNYNLDADSYEKIEDVTAVTYYKDDNGRTQKVAFDNGKIITEKENKNLVYYKFTLPGMRNGCVIEYKYRKITPYLDNFHKWYFQSDIPKVYSEYEAHIPAYFRYNISLKGNLKLSKNTSTVERKCLLINSGSGIEAKGADCSLFDWVMTDVPALENEDYMTSPKNYLAAISFELTDYTNPYNDAHVNEAKQWKDIDANLKKETYFGDQLKKKSLYKDRVVPLIMGAPDGLAKAKAIYAYIQHTFKWDGYTGKYSVDGISKALDNHAGNDADINLSLIVALNAAGLNASPVLLSTRQNGVVNSLYPVIDDFNYVIAKVDIDGQTYLLDATDPLLSFGMLPLRCLNGKGRVFYLDKPSDWVELNPQQREKSTRTLDLTLQEDGKLKGTVVNYSTAYDAYKKRVAIKKFNTTDEYAEDFNNKSPKIKVLKAEFLNVDSLDKPLIEKYEIEINIADKLNGNHLAFNPFFWDRIEVNPFKLAERSYPVDMGMQSDERLTLTIHLPPQYIIEAPPQAVAIGMPDNGGKFITNFESGDNSFTFSHVIQLNKPIYGPEEYPYLKEFYNKIIQSERAEIVFKKR